MSLPNGAVIYTDPHGNRFTVRSDGSMTPLVPPTPTPGTPPIAPTQPHPHAPKGLLGKIKHALDELDKKTGL